jgi:hypothetical protein
MNFLGERPVLLSEIVEWNKIEGIVLHKIMEW